MSNETNLFKAYSRELDAVNAKYQYPEEDENCQRERGAIHQKYIQVFASGGQTDGVWIAWNNAETCFSRLHDMDELAKSHYLMAQFFEGIGDDIHAEHAYKNAAAKATTKKAYYEAEVEAFLKRRGQKP